MNVGILGTGPRAEALERALERIGGEVERIQEVWPGEQPLELLDRSDLHALLVVLPLALRGKWLQRALARGLPVWVDGLPCQTADGARRLVGLEETHGGRLWGHNPLEWHGGLRYLAGLLGTNALGKPLYFRGRRSGLEARSGDVFWQWAGDDVGAMVSLLAEPIQQSHGMATGENLRDLVQCNFRMGDWMASFEWNRVSPELRHQWWVVGTRRAALLDFLDTETPLRIMEWEKTFQVPPQEPLELLENGNSGVPLWIPECEISPPGLLSLKTFFAEESTGAAPRPILPWVSAIQTLEAAIVNGKGKESAVESLELF